ncbi:MAG: hypothetical protein QW100_02110 [Thermoplasmatales archaeon]
MLYLVSPSAISGDGRTIEITREQFLDIYSHILDQGKGIFEGEDVYPSEDFVVKEIDMEYLRGILSEINGRNLSSKLTEDQLIEKIISVLDETEIFENYLEQKVRETSLFMRYSPGSNASFSKKITDMLEGVRNYVADLEAQLEEYVTRNAPNLKEVTGYKVAARLLRSFGGLRNLALSSSSKVQIIGAEKAFFRFKRGKGTPPKHGIIYEIPDIYRAPRSVSGKIARLYANTIVKAARADLSKVKRDYRAQLDRSLEEIRRRAVKKKAH